LFLRPPAASRFQVEAISLSSIGFKVNRSLAMLNKFPQIPAPPDLQNRPHGARMASLRRPSC
jgi:hypothetical protein